MILGALKSSMDRQRKTVSVLQRGVFERGNPLVFNMSRTSSQVKHHFLLWKQVVTTRHLGQTGKARGHHGAIMPAVDTLLELGAKSRALRTQSDKGHPFCQDEKTRLPAEMIRLDGRDARCQRFKPNGVYVSSQTPSTMNRHRKNCARTGIESPHWGIFPMGRFYANSMRLYKP